MRALNKSRAGPAWSMRGIDVNSKTELRCVCAVWCVWCVVCVVCVVWGWGALGCDLLRGIDPASVLDPR